MAGESRKELTAPELDPKVEQFAEKSAGLSDDQLLVLFRESAEEDLIFRLQETAQAARRASNVYAQKADRLKDLATRLDAARKAQSQRFRSQARERQRAAAPTAEAPATPAADPMDMPQPNVADTEKRW